jgi:hypothetical protein
VEMGCPALGRFFKQPALPGEAPQTNKKSKKIKITNESKVVTKKNGGGGGRSARQCIRLFQKSDPNPQLQCWTSHFSRFRPRTDLAKSSSAA